jgi:hypothetical protein
MRRRPCGWQASTGATTAGAPQMLRAGSTVRLLAGIGLLTATTVAVAVPAQAFVDAATRSTMLLSTARLGTPGADLTVRGADVLITPVAPDTGPVPWFYSVSELGPDGTVTLVCDHLTTRPCRDVGAAPAPVGPPPVGPTPIGSAPIDPTPVGPTPTGAPDEAGRGDPAGATGERASRTAAQRRYLVTAHLGRHWLQDSAPVVLAAACDATSLGPPRRAGRPSPAVPPTPGTSAPAAGPAGERGGRPAITHTTAITDDTMTDSGQVDPSRRPGPPASKP